MSQWELMDRPETVDVASNPMVALWMREKARREPLAFARLAGENRKRLSRLLGPGSKSRDASGEALAWRLEESGSALFVRAGAEGTVYLINYPGGERAYAADRKMGSAMTAFLERFLQDLSGFGPIRAS